MASRDQSARALVVAGICKSYGRNTILANVAFSVWSGSVTVVLGRSGTGKTTLGEIIAGTLKPDSGTIHLDSVDITNSSARRRGVALSPQEWELFPHLTALENVSFGLWARHLSRREQHLIGSQWLERVGLLEKASAFPQQLSGGQQQRVALARALAAPGSFAVLDEPFANVDQNSRDVLRTAVREVRDSGKGLILITHDRSDALMLADEVICLADGSVIQSGAPEAVYSRPTSLAAARLTGEAWMVPLCELTAAGYQAEWFGEFPREARGFDDCGLILRPEWLELTARGLGAFSGVSGDVLYNGGQFNVEICLGRSKLVVQASRPPAPGEEVDIVVRGGVTPPVVTMSNNTSN